jgi:hypothetical protein
VVWEGFCGGEITSENTQAYLDENNPEVVWMTTQSQMNVEITTNRDKEESSPDL